jgi:hypothetical protein
MSEVLQTNIFFLITGIAVIICSALVCVLLFHLIKVARKVRRLIDSVEAGAEVIAEDIQQLRTFFSNGGFIARLVRMFAGKSTRGGARRTSAKTDRKNGELEITNE